MSVEVLIKPIITEKMTKLGEKLNRFGFVVRKDANKIQIKKAIETMYGVSVKNVNTLVAPGKAKSRNTKKGLVTGVQSSFKKALVTLADGETIDFYSNI
jgi:large subunit ribosomal protein L23